MKVNIKTLVLQIVVQFLVIALALFLAAGAISWAAGWVFVILFDSFVVALTLWLLRHDPGLLQERMTGFRPDQKPWDKVIILLAGVLFFVWLLLMPLDATRFHWSRMPVWLQGMGAILLLGSFALFFLTFRENTFLAPVVRLQKERGQTVVSTGPYAYVRHPMYAAFVLFVLGTALLLGSWYGILFGLNLVIIVAIRAVLEERALWEELQGYDAYMAQVRYRFIPHLW